jgi:hypothetical protein
MEFANKFQGGEIAFAAIPYIKNLSVVLTHLLTQQCELTSSRVPTERNPFARKCETLSQTQFGRSGSSLPGSQELQYCSRF